MLSSCSEQTSSPAVDEFDPAGKWVLVQYFSTNGPICYGIYEHDTVSFERIANMPDNIIYRYKLSGVAYGDTFRIDTSGARLHAVGNYLHFDPAVQDSSDKHKLKQTLDIEFLTDKRIECLMKVETYYALDRKYLLGDVSHYIARRIN